MTLHELLGLETINAVEEKKVKGLMDSIRTNGYTGCPILVYGDSLLTGSHRFEALKRLLADGEIDDEEEVAEDVTEIIEKKFAEYEEEYGEFPDMRYDDIGWLLEGSWVEKYKEEITEW